MDRRDFIKTLGAAAGLFLLGSNQASSASESVGKKPNFLFILVDDLGWKDLGCYGSDFYETPNIDRLAAEGMKFTDAYTACPVSSPTRFSIMTGKYPWRHDATDYFGGPQPKVLLDASKTPNWLRHMRFKKLLPAPFNEYMPLEEISLGSAFKESGYSTFYAGKWHLGEDEKYWPENHGFDINKGGWSRGGPYGGNQYFSPYGNPRLDDGPDGEYLPLRLADETSKFIEAKKNEPFFAYLSFYKVHTPLMTTSKLEGKYKNKRENMGLQAEWGQEGDRRVRLVQEHAVYAGMVEAMDMAVGKVLDTIDQLGLEKDTIVIFMSDNGGLSTSEGHPTSNLPLRAGKGWLYEGGIRVPMIVRWSDQVQPGSVCHEPVTSTDFYPTMLEMANLSPKPQQHLDGESLVPLLKGRSMNRPTIFWHYPHYGNQGGSPGSAIRDGQWKLIEFFENRKVELYNLTDDIGEQHDLAQTYPDKARQLHAKLVEHRRETDAKLPSVNPNFRLSS